MLFALPRWWNYQHRYCISIHNFQFWYNLKKYYSKILTSFLSIENNLCKSVWKQIKSEQNCNYCSHLRWQQKIILLFCWFSFGIFPQQPPLHKILFESGFALQNVFVQILRVEIGFAVGNGYLTKLLWSLYCTSHIFFCHFETIKRFGHLLITNSVWLLEAENMLMGSMTLAFIWGNAFKVLLSW